MWVGMGQAPALAQFEKLHCRAKFRTCALFLEKCLRSSCMLNVRVGLYICVCALQCLCFHVYIYLPMYLSVCLSVCKRRDRGERRRVIRRQEGESITKV